MLQMQTIGLLTEDPRAYFEILEVLREQGLKFLSLDFSDPIPANVGVVITTGRERERVDFDRIVADQAADAAVAKAKRILAGEAVVRELMIGIDPGQKPGFAALGDGVVLTRSTAPSPEAIGEFVDDLVRDYPDANVVVRIGHGDRTNRNRIFNKLWDSGHDLEIVDERNTTSRSETPDEDAAVEIAMTPGYRPRKRQEVDPCPGEIRNIQRISRLESAGSLTVSTDLAKKVATGELSLDDAIEKQKNGSGGQR
jgi:xanthine/CO dehydrogenase XdhC/CoxF family maturation factor